MFFTNSIIFFRKRNLLFLKFGILLFIYSAGAASDEWHLQIDDRQNDIVLHYRKTSNDLIEFRGVTHIKSSLSAFVALFRDVDAMPAWVDRAYKATNLKQLSDTEVYAHMVTSMPFPFSYRQSIVHTHISQDSITGEIVINGRDAKPGYLQELSKEKREFLARQQKYVLIRNLKSHWAFRPQSDGLVEIEFQGYGNPGGYLSKIFPQQLLRMLIWEAPYNTLKKLRKIVLDPKYQSSGFSFIQEF